MCLGFLSSLLLNWSHTGLEKSYRRQGEATGEKGAAKPVLTTENSGHGRKAKLSL